MTAQEIKQKLTENNLENYIPVFEQNHLLDEDVLRSMTNDDYLEIGISILGDRKKMLSLFSQKTEEKKLENIEKPAEKKEEWNSITKNGRRFVYKDGDSSKLYCPKCHARVADTSSLCSNCNESLVVSSSASSSPSNFYSENSNYSVPSSSSTSTSYSARFNSNISDKSRAAAAILCFLLGALGIHRFYVGKIGSAIFQIILNIFIVGFIWVLVDFIMIIVGEFTDAEGKKLVNW